MRVYLSCVFLSHARKFWVLAGWAGSESEGQPVLPTQLLNIGLFSTHYFKELHNYVLSLGMLKIILFFHGKLAVSVFKIYCMYY